MDYKRINKDLLTADELFFHERKMLMVIGSARLGRDTFDYTQAYEVTKSVIDTCGFTAVMTGGGPAIMEAGNEAAKVTHQWSMGAGITLPFEQKMNEFVDVGHEFGHFFTRKYAMAHSADALLAFKGGVGTLDELFEIITLVQTEQMPKIPIVLFDEVYWNALINWDIMIQEGVISPEDLDLLTITSSLNEVIECLKN
jgi:uncharacterized protein (TIGR00730 family)